MCQEHSAKSSRTTRSQRTAPPLDLFDPVGEHAARAMAEGQRPPALRIFDKAGFVEAPREWNFLNERNTRARIELAAKSVGRIHHGSVTLGTGFLIANDVVMTNRHVAEAFAIDIDGTLKIRIGWEPAIDFIGDVVPRIMPSQEAGPHAELYHTGAAACFRITSVLYADPELDLALLRVEFEVSPKRRPPTPLAPTPVGWTRPEPLKLSTEGLPAGRRRIYVIGFPNQDDTADFNELKDVFQDTYDVKRLQPGYLTRVLTHHVDRVEIGHDCSTLRGNSGSPIIDLETNQVLGLHVRGSREGAGQIAFNQGIGLWVVPEATRNALYAVIRSERPADVLTSTV
jgi:glutamyl endopeptidase